MSAKEKQIRAEWQRFRSEQNRKQNKVVYTMTVEQFQQMMKSLAGVK